MKRLALWKQQDVPFVKKILELIKEYTKEGMREWNITDQLLSAPPLYYTITHKGVVSAISQCDWTDWSLCSVYYAWI